MGDEEAPPYTWESAEPVRDGEERQSGKYVKAAGRAKVTYPSGDTYEGSFNDAKQKHGRGVYTWSTAAGAHPWVEVPEEGAADKPAPVVRYDGQYVEGRRSGIGKITLPNGEKYHGSWEADRFNGDGTYYYKSGDIYSGGWQRGVRHGEGVLMYAADEAQLVGRWERGSIASGKWVLKDGTSWHGPFHRGKPLGRGVFYFPNGTMQEGEYVREGSGAAGEDGGEAPAEGEEESEEELRTVWKGGAVRPANADAAEVTRAPVSLA